MPLLGFFKRDKSKNSGANPSHNSSRTSVVTPDDDADRTDVDYVLPPIDEIFPTLSNGNASQASFASASSSRIKLPFRNKLANGSSTPLSMSFDSSKTSIDFSTTRSSTDVSTLNSTVTPRSRPSMSTVFPSLHEASTSPSSTRSVPASHTHACSRPEASPLQSASASKAGGGLFSWARERKRSKPAKPNGPAAGGSETDAPLPPLPADSFNLMSFRHVVPDVSPSASTTGSVAQQQPAPSPPNAFMSPSPRPRGGSMASESSQRISVAAFREAQARRSSSNLNRDTPSPSPRPISLADPSGQPSDLPPPRPPRAARPTPSPARQQRSQSSYSIVVSSSDDDQQSSEEEDESDSGDQSPSRSRSQLSRQRTITKQTYSRARSDLGHGNSGERASPSQTKQTSSSRSEMGHGAPAPAPRVASPFRTGPPPSSFQKPSSGTVGTRSHSLYKRERGSYSTSELAPSAAAARASTAAAANQRDAATKLRQSTVAGSDTSDSDSSEGSSDDDDAPLSTLMNPNRPGSAMSHASRAGPQQQRKPLIDLNSKHNPLTGKPMEGTAPGSDGEKKPSHLRPLVISPTDINNRLSRLTAQAGLGNYHKSSASKSEDNLGRGSGSASPQQLVESPIALSDKSSSPPATSPSVHKLPSPVKDNQSRPSMLLKKNRKASLPSSSSSLSTASTTSPTIPGHEAQKAESFVPPRPAPVKERPGHYGGFRVVSRPHKSPSLGSPTDSQVITEGQQFPQSLQQSTSSLALASGPSGKESPKVSPKYPPRSSSFMVTSRPLSGGSPEVIAPSPTQTSSAKSVNSPNGTTQGRSTQAQTLAQRPPFAQLKRRESPASSTGGSSNGKAPLTPMDVGSDYFSPDVRGSGSSPSGSSIGPPSAMKGGRGHVKRGSVTFEEPSNGPPGERGRKSSFASSRKDDETSLEAVEARRKERRRSEAKAAIELGNVINGPGPVDDEDDEPDQPESGTMGPRMSMFNQMSSSSMNMNIGGTQLNVGWQHQQRLQVPQVGAGMLSPQQFMMPPPQMGMAADPAFLAAHQQAMMIAKQAYQYAVAQQAMAAAADEWERSSNVGGYAPSAISGSGMGYGMGGIGMGMGMGGWPNGGGSMFPSAPRSMYAGSDFGGPTSQAGGWGTASVYGDAFGPSMATSSPRRTRAQLGLPSGVSTRDSVAFPATFQRSESAGNIADKVSNGPSRPARSSARPRTNTAPSKTPLPSQHRNSTAFREQAVPPVPNYGGRKPPSSWKNSS